MQYYSTLNATENITTKESIVCHLSNDRGAKELAPRQGHETMLQKRFAMVRGRFAMP